MENVMDLYLNDLSVEKKEEANDMTSYYKLLEVDQWVHQKRISSCWNLKDIESLWKMDCSVDKRDTSSATSDRIIDIFHHGPSLANENKSMTDDYENESKHHITALWSIDCACYSSILAKEKEKQNEGVKELYQMDLLISKQAQPQSEESDPLSILYQSDQLYDNNKKTVIKEKNKNNDKNDGILWSHLYRTDLEIDSRREKKNYLKESTAKQNNSDRTNKLWKALLDTDQQVSMKNDRKMLEDEQLKIQTLYRIDCLVSKNVTSKNDENDNRFLLVEPYATRQKNETNNNYCSSIDSSDYDLSLVMCLFQIDWEVDQKKNNEEVKAYLRDLYEVDCMIFDLSKMQKNNDNKIMSSLFAVDEWTNKKKQKNKGSTSNSDILEHLWNVDQEVEGLQMEKSNIESATSKSAAIDTAILFDLWNMDCQVDSKFNYKKEDECTFFNPYPDTAIDGRCGSMDIRMRMTMATDDHFLADIYKVDQEISSASFKVKNKISAKSPEILSLLQVDSMVEQVPTINGKRNIFSQREKNQVISNPTTNSSNMMMLNSTMVVPITTINNDIAIGQSINDEPTQTDNDNHYTEIVGYSDKTYFPEDEKIDNINTSSSYTQEKAKKKKNWFNIFSK